ncbi:2-oxo acid dehydrogenase subunit E2 [Brenneria goodwinii]|uniref:Dihydrolipoamide acetyltransferase component of pyruvate dehydrogenase complex n=1 Tax=Brenneria goodwinii TaxID=1109412 RepID=A0A0G4JVS4_9GAMM|nr:2-oxo acid dehydrogenase subunit E2 [Brenneria goodwinii]CPR17125.1 Dihydrolipoamide acetyltransferase component of pyruvate dehydrogenase complex [Brenneria goodwinii]
MSAIRVIEVPKWGLSMEEGTLNVWLIKEGDSFTAGQEVCEIESSKITNVLEAPFAGVLRRILVQPGETVPVSAPLALAADADVSDDDIDRFVAELQGSGGTDNSSSPQAMTPPPQTPSPAPPVAAAPVAEVKKAHSAAATSTAYQVPSQLLGDGGADSFATPRARRLATYLAIDLSKVAGSGRNGRISLADIDAAIVQHGGKVKAPERQVRAQRQPGSRQDDAQVAATPVARRLAARLGINLHDCRATGSRGRVCQADVEQAAAHLAIPAAGNTAQGETATPEYDVTAMSGMRRAIASRLQESKRNAPHFRLQVDLALDRLLALRKEINAAVPAVKLSVTDMLIKACALALVKVPGVNALFDQDRQEIQQHHDADISIAVALPAGLITPIVRAANRKTLTEIAGEMLTLVTKAKAGTLKPEEFQGGTFSISNLGMHGVRQFDAIINPPQVAILAIGAGERRVVAEQDQMVVRTLMSVTLSCDHRVVDGASGAEFLNQLKHLVENPATLLV